MLGNKEVKKYKTTLNQRNSMKKWAGKPENLIRIKIRQQRWKEGQSEVYHEYCRNEARTWRQNLKFTVLAVYSEGSPCCKCCGETRIEFLTINHINGRMLLDDLTGVNMYRQLWKREFPSGYEVLCYNCNCSKGHCGYCPHELERAHIEEETQFARGERGQAV